MPFTYLAKFRPSLVLIRNHHILRNAHPKKELQIYPTQEELALLESQISKEKLLREKILTHVFSNIVKQYISQKDLDHVSENISYDTIIKFIPDIINILLASDSEIIPSNVFISLHKLIWEIFVLSMLFKGLKDDINALLINLASSITNITINQEEISDIIIYTIRKKSINTKKEQLFYIINQYAKKFKKFSLKKIINCTSKALKEWENKKIFSPGLEEYINENPITHHKQFDVYDSGAVTFEDKDVCRKYHVTKKDELCCKYNIVIKKREQKL